MEFDVTVGLQSLNNILSEISGNNEKLGVRGYTLSLKQTVPFIPDEGYIEKVQEIIKEKYKVRNLEILECRLKGYKSFLEKEIDE